MRSVADLVAQAKASVENLGPDAVEEELDGGALLVDLREPDERAANGTIPGALHVPRGMLEFGADPASPYHLDGLEPDRRIVLHCASGGRSALAAAALQELCYRRVAHLDGGFTAWRDAGKPIELGPPTG